MEQQINVAEELDKLESQIGWIIVGSAQSEAEEVKREIKKLVQKVEEALIFQAGLPRGNVNTVADNLQKYLNYRLGHNLTGTRETEYNETKSNFATVAKADLQDTSRQLARFQYDGIVSKSNEYYGTVEQICDEVIAEYKKNLVIWVQEELMKHTQILKMVLEELLAICKTYMKTIQEK